MCFWTFLFVAGFKMGPNGSAWATVLSQAVSFVISAISDQKNGIFRLTRRNLKLNRTKVLLIIKIGFPAPFRNSISSVSFMFPDGSDQPGMVTRLPRPAQLASKFNNIAMLPGSAMSEPWRSCRARISAPENMSAPSPA